VGCDSGCQSILFASGNVWVDFDENPPIPQAVKGGKPPANVDVQIGPDNVYSDNARVWVSNGPATCQAQAAANPGEGYQVPLDLVQNLPTPGSHVTPRTCSGTCSDRTVGR
jgi:hypothetical protein